MQSVVPGAPWDAFTRLAVLGRVRHSVVMSLVSIFTASVLPIVLVGGVGYLLGRTTGIEPAALNTAALYVFVPALVFQSTVRTNLSGDVILRILIGVGVFTLLMVVLVDRLWRVAGTTEPLLSASALMISFPNSGNFALPLVEFAYGSTGRTTAVVFLVGQTTLVFTLGVYLAARSVNVTGWDGVVEIFKLPFIYALALAGLLRFFDAAPPADNPVMAAVQMLGDAAIPVMLLLLGIQLVDIEFGGASRLVGVGSVAKLAVAPLVGLGVVLMLGLGDTAVGQIFVVITAAPSGISPLIFLTEYERSAGGTVTGGQFAGAFIFVTTIASIPVVTVLIHLLQSNVFL